MINESLYHFIRLVERDLYLNGSPQAIRLRSMEARLLAALLRQSNQTVSRAALMREVWETNFLDDTRTLDVHISALRRKIEEDPTHPQRLMTVRGVGYCLLVPNQS